MEREKRKNIREEERKLEGRRGEEIREVRKWSCRITQWI